MRHLVSLLFLFCLSCASHHKHSHDHEHSHDGDHHSHDHRHPDSDEGEHHYHEAHSEVSNGVELPEDPIFVDRDGDGVFSAEEMTLENLAPQVNSGRNVFARNPIQSLGLSRGQLILTIDDGPHPRITPLILDLLRRYNIKATFFVTGNRVPSYPNVVRRAYREGHTIGNHTYSHKLSRITSSTIGSEILRAHRTIVEALGEEPEGRLLFRAPGLAWNTPKANNLNSNGQTRRFIGPIHANLGTDAPVADWHCWSSRGNKSSEWCAEAYFQQIIRTGRGIVLAHDVADRRVGNTYEMLRRLLDKLNRHGGIKNISSGGVWEFVSLADRPALAHLDEGGSGGFSQAARSEWPFKRSNVLVRTSRILDEPTLTDNSKIRTRSGVYLKNDHILEIERLSGRHNVGGTGFVQVRIVKTIPGFEQYEGQAVYIWDRAL